MREKGSSFKNKKEPVLEIFENLPSFSEIKHHLPLEIEKESMRIIKEELLQNGISVAEENEKVILRCIHTSADFDYAKNLVFSENAVAVFKKILHEEKPVIVTDTNMAFSGISSAFCEKFGIEKFCFMSDEEVAACSKKTGLTRAACSVDKAARFFRDRKIVFAIGNAPTALVRIRQLSDAGFLHPSFVVASPVGFVNVIQSKNLILQSGFDFIVASGRKGGSPIAAAIVNAVLYME